MTHSGGKPHDVGDHGERYEVTYFDDQHRQIFGWSETWEGANGMMRSIRKHPSWTHPEMRDRDND